MLTIFNCITALIALITIGYVCYRVYQEFLYEEFQYDYEIHDDGMTIYLEEYAVDGSYDNWSSNNIKINDKKFINFMNHLSEIILKSEEEGDRDE